MTKRQDANPSALDYVIAEPNPAALIESLRAFGYTPESAVADLVDNSISAGATEIDLTFYWSGARSHITLRDNGRGMSPSALTAAMRPGSQNPLEERDPKDLGRFGLGLKTASFSQCRGLSVASRTKNGEVSVRRWDLDYVGKVQEWRLLTTSPETLPELAATLGERGTVVAWTVLDRIVGDAHIEDQAAHDRFLECAERVRAHLALTFHRFLDGPRRVKLKINGHAVKAWDPFMTGEGATQALPTEPLRLGDLPVTVRPYVLPHRSKLTAASHEAGSGPKGWNASQGFYVYRNNRVLVAGDWLGLGFQKEEHCKLARIALDITNAADDAWQIDVKKSTARPPAALVPALRTIARYSRSAAQEVYRHRGKVISRKASAEFVFAWQEVVRHGKKRYRINREHPVIAGALDCPKQERVRLEQLLKFVEETVPLTLIGLSVADTSDQGAVPYEGIPSKELTTVLNEAFSNLVANGASKKEAISRLSVTEPFSTYPALVASLAEESAQND